MLAEILMCSCYTQLFHEEGHEYIKKLCHFKCKCNDKHLVYVLSCKKHPFVAATIPEMDPKCQCPFIDQQDICNFCYQVRYLFNFRTFKFCLKRIPENFQDHLVTTNQYFKSTPGCQPIFSYRQDFEKIDIFLNNPSENFVIKKTD